MRRVSCYGLTSAVEEQFTGMKHDFDTGMDYFYARYYSRAEGRFTAADLPFIDQHPANPQSWNLYGYVRNSPLIYVDRNGHECTFATGPDGRIIVTCSEPAPVDRWELCHILGNCTGGGGGGTRDPGNPPVRPKPEQPDVIWVLTFTKSLAEGPSTGAGSCLEVFTDTAFAPLSRIHTAARNYIPAMITAMQAAPAGAGWYIQQVNKMVAAGAVKASEAAPVLTGVSAAASAAAAPYVSAAAPYATMMAADAFLLVGVIKEFQAGFNGNCRW